MNRIRCFLWAALHHPDFSQCILMRFWLSSNNWSVDLVAAFLYLPHHIKIDYLLAQGSLKFRDLEDFWFVDSVLQENGILD